MEGRKDLKGGNGMSVCPFSSSSRAGRLSSTGQLAHVFGSSQMEASLEWESSRFRFQLTPASNQSRSSCPCKQGTAPPLPHLPGRSHPLLRSSQDNRQISVIDHRLPLHPSTMLRSKVTARVRRRSVKQPRRNPRFRIPRAPFAWIVPPFQLP